MEQQITTNSELDKLLDLGNYVFLKTYTEWCGPCKLLARELKDVQRELPKKGVIFVASNVDESQEIKDRFSINSVPKVFILKNKEILASFSGFMHKTKILEFIIKYCV